MLPEIHDTHYLKLCNNQPIPTNIEKNQYTKLGKLAKSKQLSSTKQLKEII